MKVINSPRAEPFSLLRIFPRKLGRGKVKNRVGTPAPSFQPSFPLTSRLFLILEHFEISPPLTFPNP